MRRPPKNRLTYAVHIRRTGNVGDVWSSPAIYLPFGKHVEFWDVNEFLAHPPTDAPSLLVAGGGAWARLLRTLRGQPIFRKSLKVAWGVGVTYRRPGRSPRNAHYKRRKGWDFYGHRDVGLAGRYVPCASCMHSAFDLSYTPEHEAVYYGHGDLVPMEWARKRGLPHLTNLCTDATEAIEFLASGAKIVTASYHGAYWGLLLGREVEIVRDVTKMKHLPKPEPGMLAKHRQLTWDFWEEVSMAWNRRIRDAA